MLDWVVFCVQVFRVMFVGLLLILVEVGVVRFSVVFVIAVMVSVCMF